MAGQRGEGGDGRSKKIYMMPGSRIDWQLRRPAKNGSKAPQGGQAPGLFWPLYLWLPLPSHTWFMHSLEQDCHDSLHGGSCEDPLPLTCKRWMWSIGTGAGEWCAPCNSSSCQPLYQRLSWRGQGRMYKTVGSSGSPGFLRCRSKCLSGYGWPFQVCLAPLGFLDCPWLLMKSPGSCWVWGLLF